MSWQIDLSHSQIAFSARHMMISKVRGVFGAFSGTINFDPAKPAETTVNIAIDASSIDTKVTDRDNHLKSADFLDVANYPQLTFESSSIEIVDDEHAKLHGNLTIRGVTNPVTLKVEYEGQTKSPWGTTNVGFSAKTKIDRKDWGLVWNVALETGGILVGDKIEIEIDLELIEQP